MSRKSSAFLLCFALAAAGWGAPAPLAPLLAKGGLTLGASPNQETRLIHEITEGFLEEEQDLICPPELIELKPATPTGNRVRYAAQLQRRLRLAFASAGPRYFSAELAHPDRPGVTTPLVLGVLGPDGERARDATLAELKALLAAPDGLGKIGYFATAEGGRSRTKDGTLHGLLGLRVDAEGAAPTTVAELAANGAAARWDVILRTQPCELVFAFEGANKPVLVSARRIVESR